MSQIDVHSLDVRVAARKKKAATLSNEDTPLISKKKTGTSKEHILHFHVRYQIVYSHQKELVSQKD